MTQLDDLQTFVNRELPRRAAMLTVAITGFDGDPNGGGAPAILTNSPKGTYYLRETPEVLYRKRGDGIWNENEAEAPATITTTTITVTVDPASTVPTPPAGTVFGNQAQFDNYAAGYGETSFKLLQDVLDVLPPIITKYVTINLTAGIHRPQVGKDYLAECTRLIPSTGRITIQGPLDANTWTVLHAGGTILSHQVRNDDPYVDCAPGTFPTDGSLRGKIAVLSNGLNGMVWDHTDSRLFICTPISPAPVNGSTTVSVRQPSAILRYSHDDVTSAGLTNGSCLRVGNGIGKIGGEFNFSAVTLHDGNCSFGLFSFGTSTRLTDFIYDKLGFTPGGFDNGGGIRFRGGSYAYLTRTSYICTPEYNLALDRADIGFDATENSQLYMRQCYFQGSDNGIWIVDSTFWCYDVVFYGAGHMEGGAINISNSKFYANNQNTYFGVMPTIIAPNAGSGYPALNIKNSIIDWSGNASLTYGIRIGTVLVQPAILLQNSQLLLKNPSSRLISYGGGTGNNTGVGIEIQGAHGLLQIASTVTLTGTAGDVKLSDGTIKTYAEIQAAGVIIDPSLNIIKWV